MIHNLILLEFTQPTCSSKSEGFQYWGEIITGSGTVIGAIIATIGVVITIINNQYLKNKELLNSLDQKSEWRKELMNVASKTFLTTDDIYRVLASLRFVPKVTSNNKTEKNDFDHMTREIYDELSKLLRVKYGFKIKQKISSLKGSQKDEKLYIYLNYEDCEIVRLYTKYLLKHHWEININKEKWEKKDQQKVIKKVRSMRNDLSTIYNLKCLAKIVPKILKKAKLYKK
ncbi:hypothetical protein K4P56_08810 [Staphylococcus epidermidis]|uniref:hypothetical protein n=1 Tax=Staphylococcus epidermidis TaxID=1282 RepID=UPI001931F9F8|nr:hypothetical protein [Staphylococcus epidermidis]MBM0791471.1 hypothetical protein [Staphylococcus epidermidis]MCG2467078.1 hypothetical protein [Staphylococcus epidermidis]